MPNREEHDVPTVVGRRSTRLSMIIPVAIKGTSADGQSFKENTWTIGINKQGARLASFHRLSVGDEVVIENPLLGHTARARVIRVGEKRFPEDPYEVGVELLEARNVWGVKFPPEDWKASFQPPLPVAEGERTPGGAELLELRARPLEPPPPAKIPAAVEPPAPPEKSAQFNMAIEALSQFAKETEEIVPPEEEGEAPPAALEADKAPALRTEAEQDPAPPGGLRERSLDALAEQVRAARHEAEGLIERLHDFQEGWENELGRVREQAEQTSKQALEGWLDEARDRLSRETDAAAWKSLEEARRRMEDEVPRSAEAFRESAAKVASRVLDEQLAGLGPILDALVASSAGRLKNELKKKLGELEPELKVATEKVVEKLAASNLERTAQAADEKVDAALASLDHTLDQGLAKRLEEIRLEGNRFASELRAASERAVDESSKALAKQGADAAAALNAAAGEAHGKLQATLQVLEGDLRGKVASFRKDLGGSTTSAFEGFRNRLAETVKGFPEELQKSLRHEQQRAAAEAVAEVKKTAGEALAQAKAQFQRQAEDFLELFDHQLSTSGQKHLDRVRTQLAELGKSAVDHLNQVAQARQVERMQLEAQAKQVLEETSSQVAGMVEATATSLGKAVQEATSDYRVQLHKTLDESVTRSTYDFENYFNNLLGGRREAILREISKQADEGAAQVVAEMKSRTEAAAKEATDRVLRQVGQAALVLKEWGDQAASRLEGSFQKSLESLRREAENVARGAADEQRNQSYQIASDLLDRLEKAASILRSTSNEPSDTPKT
ncbi:MAG: hypothetical protein DMG22_15935 [Acidobacteria bacterium]|nr:MAG: hypothetical protein DMG22_15935 [Acidobacteriota bacterium]